MSTKQLIQQAKESGKIGIFAFLEDKEFLTLIAEQALDIMQDGTKHTGFTNQIAYKGAVNQFGEPLVKAAIQIYKF